MQIVALAEWDKLHADLAKLKAELAAAWEHNAFVVAREAEARKLLYRIKRQIDDMDGGALV